MSGPFGSNQFFGAAAATGYVPEGSMWFDSGDGTELNADSRTSDSSNKKRNIISVWRKGAYPQTTSGAQIIGVGAPDYDRIEFYVVSPTVSLQYTFSGASPAYSIVSDAVLLDPTGWQHLVISFDSTQDSGSRVSFYYNGVLIPGQWYHSGGEVPADFESELLGNSITTDLCGGGGGAGNINCYISEFIAVDGKSIQNGDVAITAFGTENSEGLWVPIKPTVSGYGNNGFYLDFADSSNFGNDVSGNNNDFTSTATSTANWSYDRPADTEPTIGNLATFNPQDILGNTLSTTSLYTIGNTKVAHQGGSHEGNAILSIATTSGKWYIEWVSGTPNTSFPTFSIMSNDETVYVGGIKLYAYGWIRQSPSGPTDTSYGTTWSNGSIISCALDRDNGAVYFGKDGVWFASATDAEIAAGDDTNAGATSSDWAALGDGSMLKIGNSIYNSMDLTLRVSEDSWSYTPPDGFLSLCTANLSTPTVTTPGDYFKTVLYEGDGVAIGAGGLEVTGVGFEPDFVWIGGTDSTSDPVLCDIVQGEGYRLITSETGASLAAAEMLSTFDSDGFTLGDNSNINTDDKNYVAWCMKAGGAATTTSPAGTIASTSSVAAHGGFSIVKYDPGGSGSPGDTVGHGLSVIPSMIIVKAMEAVGDQNWFVYHEALTATNVLILNTSGATSASANYWNDTEPTDEVFSIGSDTDNDTAYIAYCFARTPGLIGIGSYTANNVADGPYIIANDGASGFRPACILFKNTESEGYGWSIIDTARNTYNPSNTIMTVNNTSSEWGNATSNVNFTSNGFKVAGTAGETNYSDDVIIYLAFAENPFGGIDVGQARAR